ncbi:MAG: DUF3185 family protein [Planctomycetota bacterium]
MSKMFFLVALILGVILMVFGFIESDSIGSDFSRLFTGEPTDKALWLLIGGGVATIVGIGGMARSSK